MFTEVAGDDRALDKNGKAANAKRATQMMIRPRGLRRPSEFLM
jgi:hypothetical protein